MDPTREYLRNLAIEYSLDCWQALMSIPYARDEAHADWLANQAAGSATLALHNWHLWLGEGAERTALEEVL